MHEQMFCSCDAFLEESHLCSDCSADILSGYICALGIACSFTRDRMSAIFQGIFKLNKSMKWKVDAKLSSFEFICF